MLRSERVQKDARLHSAARIAAASGNWDGTHHLDSRPRPSAFLCPITAQPLACPECGNSARPTPEGEGERLQLEAWDFFYCAPGTDHIIVASDRQSAIVLAVGARGRGVGGGVVYTVCKTAARYGASVARKTTDSAKAYAKVYADLPRSRFAKYRKGWLQETD